MNLFDYAETLTDKFRSLTKFGEGEVNAWISSNASAITAFLGNMEPTGFKIKSAVSVAILSEANLDLAFEDGWKKALPDIKDVTKKVAFSTTFLGFRPVGHQTTNPVLTVEILLGGRIFIGVTKPTGPTRKIRRGESIKKEGWRTMGKLSAKCLTCHAERMNW